MKPLYVALIALLLLPSLTNAQLLYPNRGGTGNSTAPTAGQVLVGQADGTYAPQATSTLGISGGGGGGLSEADLDTEAELEAILTDVLDVLTNNDGALSDDDLSDNSTSDLSEGTNLYYTEARVIGELDDGNDAIFGTATTTSLTVSTAFNFLGTTITSVSSWFAGLFDTNFASKDTGDLAEGSNLYWTNARFDTRLSATTSLPNLNLTESQITDLDHYTDADISGSESAFSGWDKDASNDFSGDYTDLTNQPTIPTNNNQLTNGAGYITDYTVTEDDVTAHQAALSITESQISDLGSYLAAGDNISSLTNDADYVAIETITGGTTGISLGDGLTPEILNRAASGNPTYIGQSSDRDTGLSFPSLGATALTSNGTDVLSVDGDGADVTGILSVSGTTTLLSLTNCDTIDTDANGVLSCGTDGGGGGGIALSDISETITGIDYNDSTGVFSLTSGYVIPLTASTTEWDTAFGWGNHATAGYLTDYTVTEGDVTAHEAAITITESQISDLSHTVDTNTTYTAGDALTLTGTDFDFDGGAAPAGDLGGTWASPSVDNDSHTHTGATLSGLDISADTNLTVAATGLELASDALSLSSGYQIPLTASTTAWQAFLASPSSVITAGTGIDWSGDTLNVTVSDTNTTYTAGDALTLTGTDIDFDGGATPAGDLGGTWASPTVDDDSHAHTGSTLSGIDISSDTNLAGDSEIVLTGDTLSIASTIARDSELHSALTITGEDYLSLSGQQITANAINPDNLASADFGDFTCNGTTCTLDAAGGSSLDGSGVANQVSYWSDTDTLTGSSTLTFDGTELVINNDNVGYSGQLLDITNDADSGVSLLITHTDADNSQGGIKIQGPAPEIEFVEDDQSGVSDFEFRVQADRFAINGRNAADTSFERVFEMDRLANGGDAFFYGSDGVFLTDGDGEFTAKLNLGYYFEADHISLQSEYVGNNDGDFLIKNVTSTGASTTLFKIDSSAGAITTGIWNATAIDEAYIDAAIARDSELPTALSDLSFDVGSVDTTEFGYLNGVTSAIQTQLNALGAIAGQVWTGVHDFGAAVLEIPNGTGPTANDPGELAHDTTDNQLILDDLVIPTTHRLFSFTLASTSPEFVSGGIIPFPLQRDGFDISEIHCYVDGGTSVVFNVSDGTNDTESVTCDTNNATDTNVSTNSTFSALEQAEGQVGTITGEPDYLTVSVWGNFTRE